MLKKALLAAAVLATLGVLAWTTEMGSYLTTAWRESRAYFKRQVPIEFEIKRAKDMLANLEQVDDKLISALASEMVNRKRLEREVAEAEAAVAAARDSLRARNEAFKNIPVSQGRQRDQLAHELERLFKRVKTMEATLRTKRELLAQHDERVQAVKDQRDGLRAQKAELQSRIEALETQVALLKAAETRSRHRLDDSQLGELNRLKELVDSLEERIEKSMTELQLREEIKPPAPSPLPGSYGDSGTLSQEIEEYLSRSSGVTADRN
jgi:chromosome segregation ATPase